MWLQDGKQHSFPVSSPEDNTLLSAKAHLDKDFEYEELNQKYKIGRRMKPLNPSTTR